MKLLFRLRFFAAVIAIAALLEPALAQEPSQQPLSADLEIATGGNTELGPFETGSAEFRRDLPLISTNQTDAEHVSVELLFVKGPDRVDSAQTSPMVGDSPNKKELGQIEGNTVQPVEISATLPVPGDYEFVLLLKGNETKSYRVTVKREAAKLTLLEMAGGAKLELESKSNRLVAPLTLRAEKGIPVRDVRVSVTSLTVPRGPVAQPTLRFGGESTKDGDGDTEIVIPRIEGLGIASFQLAADLPQSGDYSGYINLIYDGGENLAPIPIVIKRSFPEPGLDLEYAGVARNTPTLYGPSTVELGIDARESQGEALTLRLPTVSGLTRQSGSTADIAAVPKSQRVSINGAELEGEGTFALSPAQTVGIRIALAGLDEPGEYKGKLRVSVEGRQDAEVPVAFTVRRPMIWAVVPIVLGVVVSWFLRLWSTQLRGRMREVRKVVNRLRVLAEVREKIGVANPEEQDLIDAMRRPLDRAYLDLRSGESGDAQAVIDAFDAKLPTLKRWIELNRRVCGLSLGNAAYELKAKLDQVARYLAGSDSSITEAAASATLQSLPGEIKTALLGIIDDFKAQLSKIGEELDDSVLYARWVPEVDDRIATAKQHIATSDFDAAAVEVDGARLAGVKILADDLRRKLDPRPGWISQPLLDRIVQELDDVVEAAHAAAAVPPYRHALEMYLRAWSRYLIGSYTALQSKLEDQRKSTEDAARLQQINQTIAAIDTQIAFLQAVPAQLTAGNLADAKSACDVASAELSNLSGAPVAAALGGGAGGSPAADDIPTPPIALPIGDVPKNLEDIEARETLILGLTSLGDWVYQFLILLIAVLLGVYVLWAGRADWGSELDIFLAVLWGLGLHRLTTNASAYEGIEDLASKLR